MSRKLLVALCLLVVAVARAQTPPEIMIGTASIKLGMSRSEAAEALKVAGLTPHSDDPTWWFLYTFQNQQIGSLKFQNDHVVAALQNWVTLDPTGVTTANGFIGAVAEALGASASGRCTVTVESKATPTMNGRVVTLQCGKKKVILMSARSDAGEDTLVIESLGDT